MYSIAWNLLLSAIYSLGSSRPLLGASAAPRRKRERLLRAGGPVHGCVYFDNIVLY